MEDYLLYIKTVQSQSIKILIESLKEVLTDINLYFDNNGLKIMTMDNARVALVYVRLIKDNFEEYYCSSKNMCGINMISRFLQSWINLSHIMEANSNQGYIMLKLNHIFH